MIKTNRLKVSCVAFMILSSISMGAQALCTDDFPEDPIIARHVEQVEITQGNINFKKIFNIGEDLFSARMNICDGQGRPATTGTGSKRDPEGQPAFIRTSAPESNSCAGCHSQPFIGGAGDIVANVFVLAQALDPVTESVSGDFSNERNTLGMHGAGPIEMLAREMTRDLQAQAVGLPDGNHTLKSKGVTFEVAVSGGNVVASEGVNTDLIIRPFHQAGVVVSIREFSVNAMNHHHGMQAEERFDLNPSKNMDPDFDEDGVERELTIGDITALSIYQAALGTPVQVMPKKQAGINKVQKGELVFSEIGCASCHVPEMELESRFFVEPNPFNPAGTFSDSAQSFSFDMTRKGQTPRIMRRGKGAVVRAYTDLKRHNLCDPEGAADSIRFYCNENFDQGRPSQNGAEGREFFLTRKLWDVGSSAPYGHRGNITTLTEAILYHGGEARGARDAFDGLKLNKKKQVIRFLKSLQVVEPAPEVTSLQKLY